MVKALIKNTATFRLERLEDVEALHKKLQESALAVGYALTDFKYSVKPIKEDKEVVDEYYIVAYTLSFDDVKEPSYQFTDVEFPVKDV